MNLLSEHNRILRVGEGGSQEYFAGPNINITDHVISGKYWDNEINSAISSTSGDIVNEAFNQSTAWTEEQGYLTAHQDVSNLPYIQNSALGYNGSLISSISGDGFFAESANNSYHADDADHATYADSATHADSADFVATANFANSASSALNSEVANVAYTALTANYLEGGWEHDVDGFITAYNNSAFAGNGGGGRYEGISPIVVNNEEMRISAKSALLGVQDPLYFVEDSETATVIGIHDSAFPTFEGTPDGKISAINGSALNADPVVDYSAGNNIDITDHIISVTGSVPSADRADYAISATSSHFSHSAIEAGSAGSATYDNLGREITATYLTAVTGDNTPYSAGANIDITNHVVSGKDWSDDITAASSYAYEQATGVIPTGVMVTSALEYDPDNHYITAYNGSAIGKEETEYSAGPNIVINNHIIGLDSAVELTDITGNRGAILDPSGLYVSNLNQTDYTEIGLDHVVSTDGSASIGWQLGNKEISVSDDSGNGDYAILHMSTADVLLEERHQEPTPDKIYSLTGACTSAISAINMINSGDNQAYSAGANIDITDHVVSGKDWTTEIQNASSYAVDQATAQIPDVTNLDYVQNSALNIANGSITSISSYNVGHPQVPVSGESGIYLTKKNGTVYIGYSGEGGGGGAEYEGIAPIVVNNVEHKISAQSAVLGVQEPLYFVEDSVSATIIGISGMPTVEGVMYESALGLSDGYITGYNSSAFSAERAGYAVSATSANGSISAQSANYAMSGWEISDGNITGYNGTAFSAGKTYTGISPVIVDNSLNTIAVSGYGLSGINVNIWKDDVHHVIVISASNGN